MVCMVVASYTLHLLVCLFFSDFGIAWAKSQAPEAVERALSIMDVMEQQGLQPNVQTYSSVIDTIAQSGHHPEQAEDILDRMVKAGVRPDVVTYTAVINGTFDHHFDKCDLRSHMYNTFHHILVQLGQNQKLLKQLNMLFLF